MRQNNTIFPNSKQKKKKKKFSVCSSIIHIITTK